MDRVPPSMRDKIMSAEKAAMLIRSGMSIGVSGFTSVGYPKAVPNALVKSGHAKDLTICVGAAVGEEIDGAMVRAGLVKRRYAHQSNPDLRRAINRGDVDYSDIHISHFPMNINQRTGKHLDVALIECTAVTEDGLYLAASAGSSDASVRNADMVIVEINENLPEGLVGMHDIFEIGLPPHARIIPITSPRDRVGTPYIPCPKEKIAAIVITDLHDQPQSFKPISATTGISAFLLDKDTEGLAVGKFEEKMGCRGSATCELAFNNIKLPKEALLGVRGKGFKMAMETLDIGRITAAAICAGISEHAMNLAKVYANERKAFGKPIKAFQGVAFRFADMYAEIKAMEFLAYDAAATKDAGKRCTLDAAAAKLFATEHAVQICIQAQQVFGGNGYSKEYDVERLIRDARGWCVMEGSTEILRMIVSGTVLA